MEADALHVGAVVVPHDSHLELGADLVVALGHDVVEVAWQAHELEGPAGKAGEDRVTCMRAK